MEIWVDLETGKEYYAEAHVPTGHLSKYFSGDKLHDGYAVAKRIRDKNKSNDDSSNVINENINYCYPKMHLLYFLFIGWWLGICLVCLIFPIFIKGLIKKSFGYW